MQIVINISTTPEVSTLRDLKRQLNVSIPNEAATPAWLAQHDAAPLVEPADPTPGPNQRAVRSDTPTLVNGDWVLPWVIEDVPIAERRELMVCSPLQARLALDAAGLLASVEATIAASDSQTQISYEYAVEWRRNSPMVTTLAAGLQMTDQEIDDLFTAAMQIEV